MNNKKNRGAKSSSSGFTIIEIAIIVVIASVLLVAGMGLLKTSMDQVTLTENQQRLSAIQQALVSYMSQNNRLPCPAPLKAALGTSAFGRENTVNPCTAGAGGTTAPGRNGSTDPYGGTKLTGTVVFGAVPVRDLGLPDSYIADTYGYRFTYAVTLSETSITSPINPFAGAINVVDSSSAPGASVLPLGSDGSPGTGNVSLPGDR